MFLQNSEVAQLPYLKQHQIEARLHWAKQHMPLCNKHMNVVFSAEKSNLHDPIGFSYYWYMKIWYFQQQLLIFSILVFSAAMYSTFRFNYLRLN